MKKTEEKPAKQVKPVLMYLRMDATSYFDKEVLSTHKIAKVWQVYLYDSSEVTYLCESRPSYCLHYCDFAVELLDSVEHGGQEAEDANDMVMDSFLYEDLVSYMHCHTVDSLPAEDKESAGELDEDEEWQTPEDYRKLMDEYVSHYTSNPKW